jgi:predicted lipoprotein with Yx(FWY)xxD motif
MSETGADPVTTTTVTEPVETTRPPMEDVIETLETSVGSVLVDAAGRTLYILTVDEAGASTCFDACEANWPPVAVGATAAAGIDVSLGSTTRSDGSEQLTVNGRPVYLFGGDSGAGDVNGQGVGEVWFVIDPNGEPVSVASGDIADEEPEEGFYDY